MTYQKSKVNTRIKEIEKKILTVIAKSKTGRDYIDPIYLSGLANGLFFYELMENSEPGSGQNFFKDCEKLARMLGIRLEEILPLK